MFIDEARINVKAGSGGDGVVSFRREKFVPRGGPNGGDGGRGGSVYLEATDDLNTLYSFRYKQRFHADNGEKGAGQRMHGSKGVDLVIPVPVGTIAYDESGRVVADLDKPGSRAMVARGGRGGLGNVHFSTATSQVPRIAQKGEPGEEGWLDLELRLLADVGLVGLPNAGKSTLLASITAARPKIADYPFTTLVPNLGVVAVGDGSFVVADIPGLIEGAAQGAGLGLEFLRHVRRTRLLVHILDGTSEDPVRDFNVVNRELAQYSPELETKTQIVAFNKMDLPDAAAAWPRVKDALASLGVDGYQMSAATGAGVRELVDLIGAKLAEMEPPKVASAEEEEKGLKVYRLEPTPDTEIHVEKNGDLFQLTGKAAERAAALVNADSYEGLSVLRKRLYRLGATKMLEKAGVKDGDKVRVGEVEFPWISDRR